MQTGLLNGKGAKTRTELQTAFNDFTCQNYEVVTPPSGGGGLLFGYTNVSFPMGYVPVEADIMSVSYFDNYVWQTETTGYNFDPLTAFHEQGLTKGLMTGMLSRNIETNDWLKTVNYFDYRSKLIQSFFKNHKGNIERSETQYRFNGEVLKFRIEHEGINEIYDYEYNHLGNKKSFRHTKDGTVKNVSKYEYDEINRLKTKKLGFSELINSVASGSWNNTNIWQNSLLPTINDVIRINAGHNVTINYGEAGSAGSLYNAGTLNTFGQLKLGVLPLNSVANDLQTIDYSYHIRGLRGINLDGNNNLTNKLFSMRLDYETAGFYDGNIGKQEWKSSLDNVKRSFTYGYDGASRIKTGLYASDNTVENYSLNNVNYDFNGGITNLSRNGWKSNNTFGLVDNLNYTYQANSNKIQKVDDISNETASFKDVSGNDYTYYADGSLKSDANKGIIDIQYNHLKLQDKVTFSDGRVINYQYNANGKKLREIASNGNVTDYLGNIIKKNGVLYQITHDEGRIVNVEYEYNITDHLGNLRVAFKDSLGIAKIVQSNAYGVWGEDLPTLRYINSLKVNNFGYLNREFQVETGCTDLVNRQFDNIVGRFTSQDPVIEGQEHLSLYQYGWNNPILKSDADGLMPCCGETGAAVGGFVSGVGEAIVRNVKALTVNLPETLQGLESLGNPVGQIQAVAGGLMLYDKTKSDWNAGDTRTRANIVGNVVGEIGIAVAGSKGAGSIGKASVASDIAKVGEVAEISKVSSLGAGRTGVKQWLQGAGNLERGKLIQDIEGVGFKRVGLQNPVGMHFERGAMKIRLDPPQKGTPFNHMHLEYGGNSYNNLLNPVNYRSPAAHIPIK